MCHLGDVVPAGGAQVVVQAPVAHAPLLLRAQLLAAGCAVVRALDVRQQAREHARLAWPHALAVHHALRLRDDRGAVSEGLGMASSQLDEQSPALPLDKHPYP